MITSKVLYLISDERELPYGGYMMPDAAYCIGGHEIRIPIPGGYKLFVEKECVNNSQQMPGSQPSASAQQKPSIEELMQQQNNKIAELQSAVDKLIAAQSQEVKTHEEPKTVSPRNVF